MDVFFDQLEQTIRNNPMFLEDKIELAMAQYQPKLDPKREFLNDVFVGKIREISGMFAKIIFSADPNFVGSSSVLFSTIKSNPYINEYADILSKFDQFLAQGVKMDQEMEEQ